VTSLKLIDGFMEVPSGIDAKEDAVVHQGVRDSEAIATTLGAGEKEIFASDSKVADSSFGPSLTGGNASTALLVLASTSFRRVRIQNMSLLRTSPLLAAYSSIR
jgi:hypothetical protein